MKLRSRWTIFLLLVVCIGYLIISHKENEFQKIELLKLTYDEQRTAQSSKVEKSVVLKDSEDIKIFMKIFNKKKRSLSKYDMKPMDYMVRLTKKDGTREYYDLVVAKDYVLFHDNGNGYFVRNPGSAIKLAELIKKLGLE